jgi:hypothetical protein
MPEHKNKSRKAVRISNRGNRLSKDEIAEGIELTVDGAYDYTAPKTREECQHGPRPCPFVSCKYHLYLDVNATGAIVLNFPDLEPGEMEHSCALDEADVGGMTLEFIGQRLNITRERIRQIEFRVLRKLRWMEGRIDILDHLRHLSTARDGTVVADEGFIGD